MMTWQRGPKYPCRNTAMARNETTAMSGVDLLMKKKKKRGYGWESGTVLRSGNADGSSSGLDPVVAEVRSPT